MKITTEEKVAYAFLLFGLIALIYLAITFINFKSVPKEISANGVTITTQQYNAMNEQFKDDKGFIVCNMESGNCNVFWNIKK